MTVSSDDRCSRRAFALALISAIGLTLPATRPLPLVLDEHVAHWLCSPTAELSIAQRNLGYAATPPLVSWVQALSLAVLGKSEFALRLPSLAGYVLAVGAMFLGTRSVIGRWPAALASLALAWHPDVVDEVRIGRTYGLVLLAMAASLVCTMRLVTVRQRRNGIGWGVLWGGVAGLATWSHIFTIPVLGCSALVLCIASWWRRPARWGTLNGIGIWFLTAAPLDSFLDRIWTWRPALNYETEAAPLWKTCGPFLCLTLAAGVLIVGVMRAGRSTTGEQRLSAQWRWIGVCVVIGVLPILALAVAASEHPSLSNPRYRVPMAAAQATLLALMLAPLRKFWASLGLVVTITLCWVLVGRLPTTLTRLGTPQAVAWKGIAEELEETVRSSELERAPVFVQSGVIEGTILGLMPDDDGLHGYVSSRLGTFYADIPNPRFGLPFYWHRNTDELRATYHSLIETAPGPRGDIFVAAAVDTDINREALAGFVKILQKRGYEVTPVADRQPWAILYHARRQVAEQNTETETPPTSLPP